MRFPRPCATVPRRSAGPGTTRGQRPTRRARSARQGRGGRWPGALDPRRAWGQCGAIAGAMAPAMAVGLVVRTLFFRPQFGWDQETHAFPPPARDAATKTHATRTNRGQRPTRRAGSARRGRGGRWPGALGPRRAKGQRDAMAGAMARAIAAAKGLSPLRAGPGNALRFPARARRFPADRQVQAHRRPAPGPAGEKRPPGAGRALAGGFGPRRT
jgi:hypothetical protein